MQRVFVSDRYPGWYVQQEVEGRTYTFGPYSEVECEAVLSRCRSDEDAIMREMEQALCLIIVKQEEL